jgi:hypothetical protein
MVTYSFGNVSYLFLLWLLIWVLLWPAIFFVFVRRMNRSSASVALKTGLGLLIMVGIVLMLVGVLPLPVFIFEREAPGSDKNWLLPLTVGALGATLLFIAWRHLPSKSKIGRDAASAL